MQILILGAGQVGSNIAEYLASEGNNVTVVDIDSKRLISLNERIDIKTVEGHGSHPETLEQAGIEDADMLIAVTKFDNVNMMACQIAYSLYKTPTKIARIRSQGYTNERTRKKLFQKDHVPVDVLITPEQLVTEHIAKLINQPGALQLVDFAQGKVQLTGVRATDKAPMLGHELRELKEHMPNVNCRVAAVYRDGKAIMPDADTVVHVNDEVFILADAKHTRDVISEMASIDKPYKRILIIGGGNIGFRLAQLLERNHSLKVIELDEERCQYLAGQLNKTIVLNGMGTNEKLLLEENIESVDVFVAVTNDDAVNIISSMLAKRLGAGKVITLISNPTFGELMEGSVIDVAVSPQQITTSALLTYVRKGDMVHAYPLRRNAAEAMEIIARGNKNNSKVVGKRIRDIELPQGAGIGAIVRQSKDNEANSEIILGHSNTVIEENDHIIVFTVDRTNIKQIERLIQVEMGFF